MSVLIVASWALTVAQRAPSRAALIILPRTISRRPYSKMLKSIRTSTDRTKAASTMVAPRLPLRRPNNLVSARIIMAGDPARASLGWHGGCDHDRRVAETVEIDSARQLRRGSDLAEDAPANVLVGNRNRDGEAVELRHLRGIGRAAVREVGEGDRQIGCVGHAWLGTLNVLRNGGLHGGEIVEAGGRLAGALARGGVNDLLDFGHAPDLPEAGDQEEKERQHGGKFDRGGAGAPLAALKRSENHGLSL